MRSLASIFVFFLANMASSQEFDVFVQCRHGEKVVAVDLCMENSHPFHTLKPSGARIALSLDEVMYCRPNNDNISCSPDARLSAIRVSYKESVSPRTHVVVDPGDILKVDADLRGINQSKLLIAIRKVGEQDYTWADIWSDPNRVNRYPDINIEIGTILNNKITDDFYNEFFKD